MNFLSTNIKYLRQKKGLTQEDLAKIVGKSRVLVSQWESDERDITTEDIIKLSEYFCVSMDALVGKDLRIKEKENIISKTEILFNKTKDILSDDDRATIEFIMNKTINNYEKNKNNNDS